MDVMQVAVTHKCPRCETDNALDQLNQSEYRCLQCGFELAYIDTTPNGRIRGVFGWLRPVGDVIQDRYRIKAVLGKGGFGATYLVEDLRLDGKRRAIKEIPELLFDEYETKLLSHLNHPAIPDIIDRSTANGMVYLVLEFGGTRTVGSELKRLDGKIPLAMLIPWMRQLGEVLTYLHSQQPPIIHRDLKPDNILLDDNDRIMLIDFGIAKEALPSALTRTLGRAASHGFSPPEQAMGTGTDERSDIYALGATVYYLLTGQMPPAAHERVAGKEIVALSQLLPDIPHPLEEAILRALSLNPNQRQQTVKELSAVFEGLDSYVKAEPSRTSKTVLVSEASIGQPSIGTRPPSLKIPTVLPTGGKTGSSGEQPAQRSSWIALALVPVLAGIAGAGGYLYWRNSGGSAPASTVAPSSSPTRLETQSAKPEPSAVTSGVLPLTPAPDTAIPSTNPAPEQPPAISSIAPSSSTNQPDNNTQPTGPSAEDIVKQRRGEPGPDSEPPTPTPLPTPAPANPPPVKSVKPAKDSQPRSTAARTHTSKSLTAKEPPKQEPQWMIIPGAGKKID